MEIQYWFSWCEALAGEAVPAYGKIALVSSLFHPSDVAFAARWSERAPGLDGWRVRMEPQAEPQRIHVLPPGAQEPVFLITRPSVRVVLERRVVIDGEESFSTVGDYDNLRLAVQALCPLNEDDLQQINEELEIRFPRGR